MYNIVVTMCICCEFKDLCVSWLTARWVFFLTIPIYGFYHLVSLLDPSQLRNRVYRPLSQADCCMLYGTMQITWLDMPRYTFSSRLFIVPVTVVMVISSSKMRTSFWWLYWAGYNPMARRITRCLLYRCCNRLWQRPRPLRSASPTSWMARQQRSPASTSVPRVATAIISHDRCSPSARCYIVQSFGMQAFIATLNYNGFFLCRYFKVRR